MPGVFKKQRTINQERGMDEDLKKKFLGLGSREVRRALTGGKSDFSKSLPSEPSKSVAGEFQRKPTRPFT